MVCGLRPGWFFDPSRAQLRINVLEGVAADGRGNSGTTFVDDSLRKTDGVEKMRAAITVDNADAHLGHDLCESQFQGPQQVFFALLMLQVARGLERQPGANRTRTQTE